MGDVNVTYRVEGPAGLVVLDRPEKLNAFTFRMVEEIRSVVDEAAADPDVIVVVITGNGRGFSAGSTPVISRSRPRARLRVEQPRRGSR